MILKDRKYITIGFSLILLIIIPILIFFSFKYKVDRASYNEPVRSVYDVMISIDGGDPMEISLPTKVYDLEPRLPLTLTATIPLEYGDNMLFKSVFTPARIYIDGVLTYESGQEGTYPSYMNDPPTILTTINMPDRLGSADLRIEYLSSSQRDDLSLPKILIGNNGALLANQFQKNSPSLLFSLILIFLGIAMILVSLTIIKIHISGYSFLCLGMFSLSVGMWVLGECDLTVFSLPYPSLLYNMAYLGLFFLTMPFLCFGLIILNPKNKLPMQIMFWLHGISIIAAILLQILGIMDFTRSLYWFHIIIPLAFTVFVFTLLWEHFKHKNPSAKRFAPAILIIEVSDFMEVINYYLINPASNQTIFFQVGVLGFALSLAIVSGFYVKSSILALAEKSRMEYEMAGTTRLLELERLQYQKIGDNNEALKAQRHDLHHQLTVMRDLNDQGNREKLGEYIDKQIEKIPWDKGIDLSENYAVNSVASYYVSLAKKHGIRTDLNFAIPGELELLVESDLCVIIGNLLENAVEACIRMTEGERFIKLHSNLVRNILTITVDNSYDGHVIEKEDRFYSSKREGKGTGLSSIAAVVKKYGGSAKFEAKDDVFQASLYIKLNLATNI